MVAILWWCLSLIATLYNDERTIIIMKWHEGREKACKAARARTKARCIYVWTSNLIQLSFHILFYYFLRCFCINISCTLIRLSWKGSSGRHCGCGGTVGSSCGAQRWRWRSKPQCERTAPALALALAWVAAKPVVVVGFIWNNRFKWRKYSEEIAVHWMCRVLVAAQTII